MAARIIYGDVSRFGELGGIRCTGRFPHKLDSLRTSSTIELGVVATHLHARRFNPNLDVGTAELFKTWTRFPMRMLIWRNSCETGDTRNVQKEKRADSVQRSEKNGPETTKDQLGSQDLPKPGLLKSHRRSKNESNRNSSRENLSVKSRARKVGRARLWIALSKRKTCPTTSPTCVHSSLVWEKMRSAR